ncbi:uncharacterized protein SPAPADRAFT_142942 [Spathaspora passalidarum NRRL Y-27907]|uniref:Bul1 N-terminal domain-containing protein n=1 Tax=Spathaspora passalidarum (strain NRRL Y-27907 / 11-Y1) TaxID=619300 RepID=G3ASZ3_SPAPN|nr:uncharacterized protein SPAPADRAFT_142942 [Spathaspora passalidarum NRRL Y-27907]EGW30775.1 hypothetical protein SPAPADRAFT_142942 [Spathaspora passalidarum NRRL Y-27907]
MGLGSNSNKEKSNDPPDYDTLTSSKSKPKVSSILRGLRSPSPSSSSRAPRKDVPYKPTPQQQRQADLLTTPSTGSIQTLQTVSTSTQTEYFDILPSFHMFQSILKRDDRQFSEDLHSPPPGYDDTTNSSASPLPSPGIDASLSQVNSRLREYTLEQERERRQDDYEEDPGSATGNAHNANVAVLDTYGYSPLDNIDKLKKAPSSPIDIQIYVTKRVPVPNHTNELETRLKEYSSGDFVNGYIIVANTSDKPVEFGLFTVSLEGTIKIIERNVNNLGMSNHKYNRILMKKFLKMYDLNASYGYTYIPNSMGIQYEEFTKDVSDGCQIALPTDRILQPNTKYKKFFTFKFPDKLLDTSCKDSIMTHVLPPPTLGIDRTCFSNRGESIHLNKALGYGFMNVRGTPVLTKDYSFDDVSVSYTIEAKVIDKVNSNQKLSHQEINEAENDSDYVISKNRQYFLRFVPDLKSAFESNTGFIGNHEGIDGKLFHTYLNKETWRAINVINFNIELEIDEKLTKDEVTPDDMKRKHLVNPDSHIHSEIHKLQRKYAVERHYSPTPEEIKYHKKLMIGTRSSSVIFGKKKKMILSSLVRLGESRMYAKVPDKIIPYSSPKLITKYNTESASITPTVSNEGLRPVASTSSNMDELYHRDKQDIIDEIDISLIFASVDAGMKPPIITSIETNLVFWSYSTEFPLPFELGYDFFYTSPSEGHEYDIDNPVEITKNNLQKLKDHVGVYIHFLKENDIYLSRDSFVYLKSIKSLGIKKDTVTDYFKPLTNSTHPDLLNNELGWKPSQTSRGKIEWVKEMKIPLDRMNKNNVTLLPSFQNCLVGRLYCLQVLVKYKGTGNDQNEFADNIVKVDVPILIG